MSAKRKSFFVVAVGDDARAGRGPFLQTYAAETLRKAYELAMPDPDDVVYVKRVYADDAGWARLAAGGRWRTLKRKRNATMARRARRRRRGGNPLVSRYTGASTSMGLWNPRRRRRARRKNARISRRGLAALRRIIRSHTRRPKRRHLGNGARRRRGFSVKRSRAALLGWRRKKARGGRSLARSGRRRTRRRSRR